MAKSFSKVGDWRKVSYLIQSIGKDMREAQMLSLKRFGLKVEAVSKAHMSKQDLNWQPLNKEYLERKIEEGLSDNILIATSMYFQSITSYVLLDTSYAGVKKHLTEKDGTFIADIARVHEYGSDSNNIPARPLWQPTLQEVWIWQISKNTPAKILEDKLKKKGVKPTKK